MQPQQTDGANRRPASTRRAWLWPWLLGSIAVLAAVALCVVLVLSTSGKLATRALGAHVPAPSTGSSTAPAARTKPPSGTLAAVPTDLTVATLIKGNGPPLRAGQSVVTNYVGYSFQTGQEFDSSWKRGQPFTFTLGAGHVIRGWDQGLVGITVGSRIQMDLPPAFAYGDAAGPVSGPLRFIIDVISAT